MALHTNYLSKWTKRRAETMIDSTHHFIMPYKMPYKNLKKVFTGVGSPSVYVLLLLDNE